VYRNRISDKGKLSGRMGRKDTGLRPLKVMIAGLPKIPTLYLIPEKAGGFYFGGYAENGKEVAMKSVISILLLLIVSAAGIVISFLIGKKKGALQTEETHLLTSNNLDRNVRADKSKIENLQKEVETLNKKAEKYLYFLVRLPEAVKQINSNLSFDGLITAIIRLTKDLTGTEAIEVYIFNRQTECLKLVAAYGTDRKKSVEIMLGEGLIGKAASLKTIISRGHPGINVSENEQAGTDTVAPIVFTESLLGVIAVGEMKNVSGSEKRFLAMLADLAAIALNNIRTFEAVSEEAIKDALSGLYNKKYFIEEATERLHSSASYDFPFSIFIFDIDHFKNYNDRNGHVQGDFVLKELGRLLRENTRSTNIVARYGGEEFILFLQNTPKDAALKCADNIRRLIETHDFPHREKQPLGFISISGGVATFPFDGSTLEEIIRRADEALYAAKASERNCVMCYEPKFLSEQ
jgi:diguanylate cyclase (GGDEF)-like protein